MFEAALAAARTAIGLDARAAGLRRELARALGDHAGFLVLVTVAPLTLWLVDHLGYASGASRSATIPASTSLLIVIIPPYALALATAWHAVMKKQSWLEAWRSARGGLASTERVVGLTITVAAVKVLMVATLGWKVALPAIAPYSFDAALAHWDRVVHGTDPWRLLAPFVGGPVGLRALDTVYLLWFVVFPLFVVWQGWRKPSEERTRFLLALALTWVVLAVLVAVAVSSAGPVYFERVTGGAGPYADLLGRQQGLHLAASAVQEELWWAYQSGPRSAVAGISAFPSLHVAMPALMAFSLWRVHRGWAVAMWGFTLATLIASVMLAWHYALDGEASIVLVGAIWWLCGPLSASPLRRTAPPL